MALLDDLATLVSGLGAEVQLGRFQPSPDTVIALLETGGLPPVRTVGRTGTGYLGEAFATTGIVAEMPGVQALVRARGYAEARALAVAVMNALDNYGPTPINGVRYDDIQAQQRPPVFLGPDQNDRMVFSVNVVVTRAVTT